MEMSSYSSQAIKVAFSLNASALAKVDLPLQEIPEIPITLCLICFINLLTIMHKMVEAAGIEPASER